MSNRTIQGYRALAVTVPPINEVPAGTTPLKDGYGKVLPSSFRSTRFAMVVLQVRPFIIQLLESSPANPDRLVGLQGKCPGVIGFAHCLD
jgi:hypothetical protein